MPHFKRRKGNLSMDKLIDSAAADMEVIEKLIARATDSLANAPEGTLKIIKKGGHLEYAQRFSGEGGRVKYISKDNGNLIKALAQKDYDMKILRNLIARKLALEKFEEIYPCASLESIYEGLTPERKALVKPVILTNDQYVSLWFSASYAGKGFDEEDESRFFTDKGERVRSKSEVIIANYLFRTGIPYKYECPLSLPGKMIYPDFTILDVKNRCVFYLEHFGMMDDPEYSQSFVNKLNTYQSGGIFPGRKLIMTFETSKSPLDTRMVKQTVEQYITL